MTEQQARVRPRRSLGAVLLEFLGSMNLAITLLMVVAVASIIGTVMHQNEPYNNYVMKFGPFWFEVYRALNLYDVYSATWFLVLLGILLVSTSVCVYRYTPSIMRDMRQFRLDVQAKSLRGFHHQDEWQTEAGREDSLKQAQARLEKLGYRMRRKDHADHTTLAGMKGASGRLGYILTHVSIVVICIGGLMDGNIGLKIGEMRGTIVAETRDLPVTEVPPESILQANSSSFRGSVNIPEGARANFIFLGLRDGYVVQKLPFTIELEEFRIEHYPSGQPKSYQSDLIIYDDELPEPFRTTIAVNEPLIYRGHAIYQASFSDGGSRLNINAWSLDNSGAEPLTIRAEVGSNVQLNTPRGAYTLELTDFNLFNIFPADEVGVDPSYEGGRYRNFGPSTVFRLRSAAGDAREYVNYQSPVPIDGRYYFLSGMRENVNDDYHYLHIPADSEGSVKTFMDFLALARNPEVVRGLAERHADLEMGLGDDPQFRDTFVASVVSLVRVFMDDGFEALIEQTRRVVPEEQRSGVLSSYVRILQSVLGTLYLDMLAAQGHDINQLTDQQSEFFDDLFTAVSLMGPYGSPLYLQLKDFVHVEASGLQITKAPGQNIVYLGCLMLMLGIMFMFYIHHRRLWVMVSEQNGKTQFLFAAAGHRQRKDFDREFAFLQQELRNVSGAAAKTL